MFGKKRTLLGFMLAATGIPYFLNEPQAWESLKKTASSAWSSFSNSRSGQDYTLPFPNQSGSSWRDFFPGRSLSNGEDSETVTPMFELASVVRFDVTPNWVLEYWPRVTTVIADHNLEGLRTTLVTGTNVDDIAGSITYYFDKKHVVQRIAIRGFTGDERKIVALAINQFGFQAEPTLGGGLYCSKWNGRPVSALRIEYAPIVRSSAPNTRFDVMFEVNRPGGQATLSNEFHQVLVRHSER